MRNPSRIGHALDTIEMSMHHESLLVRFSVMLILNGMVAIVFGLLYTVLKP